MLSRWSNWTATGLHMYSRQKIGWATSQKKNVSSPHGLWGLTWTPHGLHMESVGEGQVLVIPVIFWQTADPSWDSRIYIRKQHDKVEAQVRC